MFKKAILFIILLVVAWGILSFSKDRSLYVKSVKITPVNVDEVGFDFLSKMQGQWLGINSVAGYNFNWFSFDYRPISESHLHGIFEGGSMGNLLTSYFIADFKGQKTIMARNGGLLNGIYRTSYFVMDSLSVNKNDSYYRLIDAVGGKQTMYMELRFKKDSLYWNSYTSNLGSKLNTKRHMTFKGVKNNDSLALKAASKFDFPKNKVGYSFPNGFDNSYLYMKKSATFLAQGKTNNVYSLSIEASDPITISDYPHIASLSVHLNKSYKTKKKQVLLNVSTKPFTDEKGKLLSNLDNYNSNVLFPILINNERSFEFTYVHPGDYYVTAIVDMDNSYSITKGDYTHASKLITVVPSVKNEIIINNIDKVNELNIVTDIKESSTTEIFDDTEIGHIDVPVIDRIVYYNDEVKTILNNNCITCHSGPSPSYGLDLTAYKRVKKAIIKKELIRRVNNKQIPMPPSGLMTLEERLIIFKWVKDGMPIE